ncbi:MAG: HDOD domain-containing protein [Gammaproteobacteria bacterium]|nr:HDOD domain-containing protein [Gammaproteobacteria bacterium]
MSEKADEFFNQLSKAVETDQLTLPTLPEVAIKIRDAVENSDASSEQIANTLSQDPSLSTRLIQLANSPLYRTRSEISSLHMAVTRLGAHIVRDLVTTLVMRQVYQPESKLLHQYFQQLWQTSIEVASICRVLATTQDNLDTEQAMLAGLIHNIGSLPILQLIEHDTALVDNMDEINSITLKIQSSVAHKILSFWNFPKNLIAVVSEYENSHRYHDGPADYVDLVQVAIQQNQLHKNKLVTQPSTDSLTAFNKLSLDPEINIFDNEHNRTAIDETRSSLTAI